MKLLNFIVFTIFSFIIIFSFISCGENNLSMNYHSDNDNKDIEISASMISKTELTTEEIIWGEITPETTTIEYNEEKKNIYYDTTGAISVSIIRNSITPKDDDGNILVEMYFDKPVLSGETEVVAKINTLFDDEEYGFFYGSNKSLNFKEGEGHYNRVLEGPIGWNVEAFENDHFYCMLDTDIMYMENNILSVKEYLYWMMGGVNGRYYYGINIDTSTGELITLDYFFNENINDFNEKVISQLINELYHPDENIKKDEIYYRAQKIEDLTNMIENYNFADYKYFYDGEKINLIFHGLEDYRSSYIMQIELYAR